MRRDEPDPMTADRESRRRSGSDQTTERLLQAAATEFVERGFDAARVSAIARRAGLTSGAVYARWPTKTDVMVAALDHIFEQILPEHRLKGAGADGLRAREMVESLGEALLGSDESRAVLVQAFGSAHNNDRIRECLQHYLNQDAEQVSDIIEEGKRAGFVDSEVSTAAMSLLCQAASVGVHLLVSAGLDERYVPTAEEWNTLASALVDAAAPPTSDAS